MRVNDTALIRDDSSLDQQQCTRDKAATTERERDPWTVLGPEEGKPAAFKC